MSKDIRAVIRYALVAHWGLKYGDVMPYIVHLMLVARHFDDYTRQAIALLHDTLEDTHATYTELLETFGETIADTVLTLTRSPGEDYLLYIKRVKRNPLATEIKIADLEENMFISKYGFSSKASLLPRYETALKILKKN